MKKQIKISILGLGNLAHSLIPALQGTGANIKQVISRDKKSLSSYQDTYQIPHGSTEITDLLPEVDMVFLCLPDALIESTAKSLAELGNTHSIFLHSSGSIAIDALEALGDRTGVFYPMQIFTKSRISSFEAIPLFLEANPKVYTQLESLARVMSSRVYQMDSTDRLRLHMGAVMVCNFTNYLYRMAQESMPQGKGLDFSIYEPLIREHIDKAFNFGPENSQTGPAIRKDIPTIQKHLDLLEEQELHQDLYWEISKLIRPDLEI